MLRILFALLLAGLCLPRSATPAETTTWGRIKTQFQTDTSASFGLPVATVRSLTAEIERRDRVGLERVHAILNLGFLEGQRIFGVVATRRDGTEAGYLISGRGRLLGGRFLADTGVGDAETQRLVWQVDTEPGVTGTAGASNWAQWFEAYTQRLFIAACASAGMQAFVVCEAAVTASTDGIATVPSVPLCTALAWAVTTSCIQFPDFMMLVIGDSAESETGGGSCSGCR